MMAAASIHIVHSCRIPFSNESNIAVDNDFINFYFNSYFFHMRESIANERNNRKKSKKRKKLNHLAQLK